MGFQKLTLTVPAGAFPSGATLKLTLETTSSATTFSIGTRTASSVSRSTQSVPSSATPIAAFVIDDGGATLAAPMTVSISDNTGPAAGQTLMISGFNNNAFDDVAPATYANGSATESTSVDYPGLTLASNTLYVLYSAPTSSIAKPAASIAVAGPATLAPTQQGTYSATETTVNGFPFFGHTLTYSSSPGVGTIASTATGAVLTAGGVGGTGSVIATDAAVPAFTGSAAVTIASARPGATGLSEQYAGTLTEAVSNNAIDTSPVTTTTTSAVSLAVSTAPDTADTSGSTTGVTFTANESDASNLETLTSTTTSTALYQQQSSGVTDVRLKKTVADESSGVVYENDYGATNGLTTIIPETAGTFSNDASETYLETDPGLGVTSSGQQVTETKTIAANGTYNATFLDPNGTTGTPVADTATENADFSGVLNLNSVDPGAYVITFVAPSGGMIGFTRTDPNIPLNSTTSVPNYIPSSATQPSSETDTIATGAPLSGSCTNGTTYPTANLITQTLTIVDSIFGTVETRTTQTYDVNGVGTVCIVVADTINAYYDYSDQEGGHTIYASPNDTPVTTTTESEALSLTTTNASTVQSVGRSVQSVAAVGAAPVPAGLVATHVAHLAQAHIRKQLLLLRNNPGFNVRGGTAK